METSDEYKARIDEIAPKMFGILFLLGYVSFLLTNAFLSTALQPPSFLYHVLIGM